MNPVRACQVSVAAALLADAAVTAIVADTADGRAVFAVGQPYDDVYPRVSLEAPQWIDRSHGCGRAGDLAVTAHEWARGADCTLVAGDLADAVALALSTPLTMIGWSVSSWEYEGSTSVGDPTTGIEHRVSRFRYSVQAKA